MCLVQGSNSQCLSQDRQFSRRGAVAVLPVEVAVSCTQIRFGISEIKGHVRIELLQSEYVASDLLQGVVYVNVHKLVYFATSSATPTAS